MNMSDVNTAGTFSNAMRGIKTFSGTNPDQFGDWYKSTCFTLNIARPDAFPIL